MKDKFIHYKDILDGQDDVPEKIYTKQVKVNPNVIADLINIFKIKEISNQIDNTIEIKRNEINKLKKQLNYSYDEFGKKIENKNSSEPLQSIRENIQRKEEFQLVKEDEKINILEYIAQKALIVDKFQFIGEDDLPVTCLCVTIGGVDTGYEGEDEPCIFIQSEFILNDTGNIEQADNETSWEININEIKEFIVEDTRYIFLL